MAKVFDVNFGKGSFRDRISETVPGNTNVIIKKTEKGRTAWFPSGAALEAYGVVTGVKTIAFIVKPSGNGDILLDDGTAKLSIVAGNISGTGLTQCYVNNSDTDAISFNAWSLVIAEFSGGIDFATDFEIDPTMSLFLASVETHDSIITTAERESLWQKFLNDQNILVDPVTNRGVYTGSNSQILNLDGTNWDAQGTTETAFIGDFRISSGSFRCVEDSTGKYIECVTNGVLAYGGLDLSEFPGNGYIRRIDGSLTSLAGGTVDAANPTISHAGNITFIQMTAGQILRNITISRNA